MADILLDVQSAPTTPSAGQAVLYIDTTTKTLFTRDDAGLYRGQWVRAATAAQGAGFASDTYVTNSGLLVPGFGMQAGMVFMWQISGSKSAAGTNAPVYTVRLGAAQSTADTARITLTSSAQTAAADVGILTIMVTVRNVGASGVLAGTASWSHNAAAAGFASTDAGAVEANSAAFDNSAVGGQYLGLSINGGASASWTLTQVVAELLC
jgi:hypothetical protein